MLNGTRILFVSPTSIYEGGAESYLRQIAKELENYSVETLCIEVNTNNNFHAYDDLSMAKINAIIDSFHPSIIHFNKSVCLPSSMIKRIRKRGIPIILTVHDYFSNPLSFSLKTKILNYILGNKKSHVDRYIIPSKSYFNELLPSDKIVHIPHFIDENQWYQYRNTERRSGLNLLFVGRLTKLKGIFLLIEAFDLLHRKYPEINLTIIGDGEDRNKVEDEIKKRSLLSNVKKNGMISHEALRDHYNSSTILVIPSLNHELFGLVGIEAIMCGLPVVASNCKGIMEWCIHEKTGLLFERGCKNDLVYQLERLLFDEDLYNFIRNTARGSIQQKYNKELALSELLTLYKTCQ